MGGTEEQAHFDKQSIVAKMLRVPMEWNVFDKLPEWSCLNMDAEMGGETDPWPEQLADTPVCVQVVKEKIYTPDDMETMFPMISFEEVEESATSRHKGVRASRIKAASDGIKEFTLRFIFTLNKMMQTFPNCNFVVAQDGYNHLALACGWLYTKYAQAIHRGARVAFSSKEIKVHGNHSPMLVLGRFTPRVLSMYANEVGMANLSM